MRSLNRVLLVSALSFAALSVENVALAQDPNAAACFSAREEMKKLSAKNAWAGVERKYEELLKLNCSEMKFDDHFLGAQAAKYQGKTFEVYERLGRAKAIDAKPDVVSEIEAIEGRYGRIEIQGTFKVLPTVDVVMPFSPDERKSIEWAQKVLAETGSFKGMLPIDIEYKLNGAGYVVPFTPKAGADWQVFDLHSVGNWKKAAGGQVTAPPPTPEGGGGGEKPPAGGSGVQGNIDTAGPVALIGFNYLSSPEPKSNCPDGGADDLGDTAWIEGCYSNTGADGEYVQTQIGALGGAGLSAEVGAEVVFTGKKFAASGTVAYSGAFAPPDSAHTFRGWLAGSFRPGNLRLTFGPTYGVTVATGEGVASWYDRTSTDGTPQDHTQFENEKLPFGGTARSAGFQFTAGYGLLDFGPMQGVVELGGSWATDGDRSYINAGARVGVVPYIKRFKG